MTTQLPAAGCHKCGTPVSETPTGEVLLAVTVDTGMAYVVMCPDCAGVDPAEAVADPEYDDVPVDLDACCRCNGSGGVQVEWNHWTGAAYDPCPDCDGSGRRPVQLGGAA